MKILRNKTYQGMVDKVKELTDKDSWNATKLNKLKEEKERLQKHLQVYEDTIHKLKVNESVLEEEKHKLLCAKGGYVKEINKLKKQVEELTFKLEESMTDKYLVKKIKPGRTPKGPQMKIKDCSRISNISRKVFGKQC